jgi:hypothetical protein
MAVDVAAVNRRIADGLGDRMVTIEVLPATVIEFRDDGAWHIASIITERNLTRRMEPHELVVFDVGSNVKEILGQLQPLRGKRDLNEELRHALQEHQAVTERVRIDLQRQQEWAARVDALRAEIARG